MEEVTHAFQCSRKQAKELYLRIMNGGSTQTRMEENELPTRSSHLPLLSGFETDAKVACYLINKSRPDLRKTFEADSRPRPWLTTMSYAISEIEDQAISIAEGHLDTIALCFDGILVKQKPSSDLLKTIEEDIFVRTGFRLPLELKDWDDVDAPSWECLLIDKEETEPPKRVQPDSNLQPKSNSTSRTTSLNSFAGSRKRIRSPENGQALGPAPKTR